MTRKGLAPCMKAIGENDKHPENDFQTYKVISVSKEINNIKLEV